MDAKFYTHLTKGTLVTVYQGAMVADMYGTPPMTVTAKVMEEPIEENTHVWLEVQMGEIGTLPQMYAITEILGLVFRYDLVKVTRSQDGQSIEATLRMNSE